MKKLALAIAASFACAPAMAGVYINTESNASYTGNDFTSRTTDLHIGYEDSVGDLGYYIQGGPAFVHTESTDDTETQFSGKVGASVAATEDLAIYAEVSGISNEDSTGDDIIDFGGKIGAKFVF